jgi:hypothetical protein
MKKFATVLFAAFLLGLPLRAEDAPLVIVSARHYLVAGDSTVHLYLYGLDGKLRKQLTTDAGQDDRQPQFSHDGKSVLFTRTTSGAGLPNTSGKYVLQLSDGTIKPVSEAGTPQDYAPTIPTTEFNDLAFFDPQPGEPYPDAGAHAFAFTAPDSSTTLIQLNPADGNASYELKFAGGADPVSTFPGYTPNPDIGDTFLTAKDGPFLLGPDRYGALFVNRHRDSMWAFDLRRKTWHEIQKEWVPGDIYAPKDKSGFYFVRCSMEPLGDSGKTVLSAYLEWWDAAFHPVVLGPKLSVTYGAATWYGRGETSAIVDEQRGS